MTFTSRKTIGAALVVAAAIAAVLWWASRGPTSLHWQQGARQTYSFTSRTLVHAEPGVMNTHLTRGSHVIEGQLNLRVFDVSQDAAVVGLQFSRLVVTHERRRDGDTEALLSNLFYVSFSPDGEMLEFDFPNTIAELDRQTFINVMRSLQMIVRQEKGRSWTTTESDRLGAFASSYQLSGTVQKSKQQYTTVHDRAQRNIHQLVDIKRSITECSFGEPVTWLDSCDGDELVAIKNESGKTAKLSASISLERMARGDDSLEIFTDARDPVRDIARWKSLPIEPLSIAQKRELAALRQLIGEVTLNEYIDELFVDCTSFKGPCVSRVAAFLKLHPEAAAQIPDYLLREGLNEHQRAMLVNALQTDKSVYSQKALLRIIEGDEFPSGNRIQSVVALGDLTQPAAGIIDSLWAVYKEEYRDNGVDKKLSDNSVLSLGRIARSMRASEDSREAAEEIVAELHAELGRVDDPGRLSSVMYAAANSGERDFVDPLGEYLTTSENPRNRASAAQALGVIPGENIDTMYANQLDAEENLGVRNSIMKALNGRDAADVAVAKVCQGIEHEENDIVRGEMYRFLLKNRQRHGVKETLRRMMALETSMENKRIISRALASRK